MISTRMCFEVLPLSQDISPDGVPKLPEEQQSQSEKVELSCCWLLFCVSVSVVGVALEVIESLMALGTHCPRSGVSHSDSPESGHHCSSCWQAGGKKVADKPLPQASLKDRLSPAALGREFACHPSNGRIIWRPRQQLPRRDSRGSTRRPRRKRLQRR